MKQGAWQEAERRRIEAALERIGLSRAFASAGRMYPLLQYLVRAELDGTAARLNQHRIAVEVLGRDERFDPSTDSIVRVEMGRLRTKLMEYYATDGADDDVSITLPRGRYRPSMQIKATPAADAPRQQIRFCSAPDGTRIAWSTSGSGYPVIKAANWMSHLEYDYQSPIWRHWWQGLSRRYQLVRYDARGCGLSDRDVPDLSFESSMHDLEEVVEASGHKRFALLGISQGAAFAVAYAARYPERVSHLVLYGGYVQGGFKRGTDAEAQALLLQQLIRIGWGQPHGAFRQVFASLFMPEASPDQIKWFDHLQRVSASPEGAEKLFNMRQTIDVAHHCASVRAPTLVLHAQHELVIPFSQSLLSASTIPGARLVPLESRNHLILEHEPAWDRFMEEVTAFLPTL